MKLGTVSLRNPFLLAPMAEFTNAAMRRLAIVHGAALVVTEMVVGMHLVRKPEDAHILLNHSPGERPIAVQLAAGDPDEAAGATEVVNEWGFDLLDLNLGCSVRRIVSGGMGTGLACDRDRLEKVLKAMIRHSRTPVTVKMRTGPDETSETAVDLARLCEDLGVAAVTVHGRHARQGYRGRSDPEAIARVARAVSIPVIANGDVKTPEDAVALLRNTDGVGVMIGRGALGNPWIFERSARLLETGDPGSEPSFDEVRLVMLEHYRGLVDEKGRNTANLLFRKQTSFYAKRTPHPRRLRQAIHFAGKEDDLASVIEEMVRL